MRKKILLLMALVLPFGLMAQSKGKFLDKLESFIGKADTLGVMQDNNKYVIDGLGSITDLDGTEHKGTVKYVVTLKSSDMMFVQFIPEGEMTPKIVKSNKLTSFVVKGRTFVPVRAKLDDLSIGNLSPFMEMLNSNMDDKFKMFMYRKLEPNTSGIGTNSVDLANFFFVSLPEFKNAHSLDDIKFMPFAKRMSGYLADYPELAKRIADKEEGYKVSMLNGAANAAIYYRIMGEYNDFHNSQPK